MFVYLIQGINKMNFLVNRNLIQEGRGLSNIFGSIFRKSLPFFGKLASKTASIAKNVAKSDFGKEIARHSIDGLSSYIENKLDGNQESADDAIQNMIEKSKSSAKNSLAKYAKRKIKEISNENEYPSSSHKIVSSKKRKGRKRHKKNIFQ